MDIFNIPNKTKLINFVLLASKASQKALQRYKAGSSKCSTKPLSFLLTTILTVVKEKLQEYCTTIYSRSGVNQMWIIKNSKELLVPLRSQNFIKINSIKTYDYSTLYTTIPHDN